MNVGIVGHGFVGLACETGFQTFSNIYVYDKYKDSDSLEDVVENCKIIFLCLPTPTSQDKSCDTSIIESVIFEIDKLAKDAKTLVIKSTVPPGTTEFLSKEYKNHSFVFNPEFLTEKNFINDFLEQDRIVLGKTPLCDLDKFNKLVRFYKKFVKTQSTSEAKIVVTNSTTAEMVKYTANCYLANKISFFNEMYEICEKININYEEMLNIVTMDERIGKSHSQVPGHDGQRGFGLSCFPKDLNALIAFCEEIGVNPQMLNATWEKNLSVREVWDWLHLPQVNGEYENK